MDNARRGFMQSVTLNINGTDLHLVIEPRANPLNALHDGYENGLRSRTVRRLHGAG